MADAMQGGIAWREVPAYMVAQVTGAFGGVAAAHVMFCLPLFFASHHVRSGGPQLWSEFIATFGLLSMIWGCSRARSSAVPFAVGTHITAAYWFTSSTSFANPAVHAGSLCERYVRRHSARRRAGIHRRAICRRVGRDFIFSLGASRPTQAE
jgi:glycerol uptake facilitator-like aquaporin